MTRAVALLALIAVAVPVAAAQAAGPPRTFVGVVSDDAFVQTGAARQQTLQAQRRAGVGLLRQTFDWARLEPAPGQFDLAATDAFVLDAARAGITVLPVLFGEPVWATSRPLFDLSRYTFPPRDPRTFAAFATAIVNRYGTRGTLWSAHREVRARPMRAYQVWNEPNLVKFWMPRVSPAGYARMLRLAGSAIHRGQPGAKVLTGGLPDSHSATPLLRYVRQLYARGAARGFDVLAVNAYSRSVTGFMRRLRAVRTAMRRSHDGAAGLWVTEFGWSDAGPGGFFRVGPTRQATLLRGTIRAMARQRRALRLQGFVYYAWRDAPPYAGVPDFWGLHTGLYTLGGSAKPAAHALTSTVRTLR